MDNKFSKSNEKLSIAVNGCNSGLGMFLAKHFSARHRVKKVSSRLPNFEGTLSEVEGYDIFINNASDRFFQAELFLHIYDKWRLDHEKLIINIGSRASALNSSINAIYATSKNALNFAVSNCLYKDNEKACRVSIINLGVVGKLPKMSLDLDHVATAVEMVIYAPADIEFARLDMHHKAPYQTVQEAKKKLETDTNFKVF